MSGADHPNGVEGAARPLDGVTVVDLSRVLAGPLCGQMLADHGAEVIKVEPPAGDDTRTWGPPFLPDGTGAYFTGLNRNKHNIALDLRTEAGMEVLDRLLADADVVIENFKAGTLEKWGLSDEAISERYPRLIHCRITGFGTDGPMGGAPGYDAVLQAYGAVMSINGEAGGPPTRVGVPIVDMMTGYLSFSGILLALRERDASGRGQLVDAALLDSAIAMLHPHSANLLNGGDEPVRMGSAHSNVAP
ncbi:MAG: CaiB/BaiF CoA transferase family protein, partial [Brevibacterium yomogidense]